MTCRFAYATNLSTSLEIFAWSWFLELFCAWRRVKTCGMLIEPGDWMFICLMACVQWPRVLAGAMFMLDGLEPRDADASQWYAFLRKLLRFADAQVDELEQKRAISGRGKCKFGLVWLCERLGVIVEKEDSMQRSPSDVFKVGGRYVFGDEASSQANIQSILGAMAGKRLPFPVSAASSQVASSQARTFGEAAFEMSGIFAGPDSDLSRRYLCRTLLGLCEHESGSEVWDQLGMGVLLQWLPDQNRHCTPLYFWRCEQVRLRFGMSPLMVSSVACRWAITADEHRAAVKKSSARDILNVVRLRAKGLEASSQVASGLEPSPKWPGPHEWAADLHAAQSE